MDFTWRHEFTEPQVDEVLTLMRNEWWCSDRSRDDVKKMLENTDITISVFDTDDTLSGVARVLTDYTYKALIFDVIVKPDCRDIGLGKEIIQHILELPALSNVQSFELYCPERIAGFYQKLGFTISSSKLLTLKKISEK